jgi:hypothetical protein
MQGHFPAPFWIRRWSPHFYGLAGGLAIQVGAIMFHPVDGHLEKMANLDTQAKGGAHGP